MSKVEILDKLRNDLKRSTEQLEKITKELGLADSAKESRFPTGRVELEDKIKILDNAVRDIKGQLRSLEKAKRMVRVEMDGEVKELILVDSNGNLSLGTVSGRSPFGKQIHKAKKGDIIKLDSGLVVKILKVY